MTARDTVAQAIRNATTKHLEHVRSGALQILDDTSDDDVDRDSLRAILDEVTTELDRRAWSTYRETMNHKEKDE